MISTSVDCEEEVHAARRLCEAGAWSDLLDFARSWRQESSEEPMASYYLALAHTGLGQFVQAETAYRRALALNDSDAKSWSNLGGLLYENLQRPIDGIRCVEKSLRLDPSHKFGWANLAIMVGRLGHHSHAISFADRAIALDPHFVEAHLHKGFSAQALGKTDVLREVCTALSAIPPEQFHRAR